MGGLVLNVIHYDASWDKFAEDGDYCFALVKRIINFPAYLKSGISCRAERLLASQALCCTQLSSELITLIIIYQDSASLLRSLLVFIFLLMVDTLGEHRIPRKSSCSFGISQAQKLACFCNKNWCSKSKIHIFWLVEGNGILLTLLFTAVW
jgi:hypothetical protein